MNPESSARPGPIDTLESFQASFRRGRRLIFVLAAITGAALWADALSDYLAGKNTGGLPGLLIGWAFVGWICWCVFQGGRLSGRCFLVVAIPVFLGLLLGTLALVFNIIVPGGNFSAGIDRFREIGSDWKDTLWFLSLGAWAAYTIWVLLISKDARLYREAKRQGIAETEANAFKWPPARRRSQ